MRSLTLIVKATRHCNLRCNYCHDWRSGPDARMSFEVLANLVWAALSDPEHERVVFVWHGGETMLLPIEFYEKALYLQARFRRPGQTVANSIQTNGTRIDDRWARFLRDHEFQVSVSLDGPPSIHDRHRLTVAGQPSYALVREGMRRLREHGVGFGVLMVVDREALAIGPDLIFDFFLEEGISQYGLLAATPENNPEAAPGSPAEHYVTPSEMTAFLARLYDRWIEHGDERIRIRELEGLRARVSRREPGLCTFAGGCLGQYFSVEPDGDVSHCDVFVGDPAYRLGNVLVDSFRSIRTNRALAALAERSRSDSHAMAGCPEFSVCNGWCPHERYLSFRHDPRHDPGCCGLRDLIRHVRLAAPSLART